MGATVFNADEIARDMWKLPEVQKKAETRWGAGFFNGNWNTVLARIAEKIFQSDDEYKFASDLIHIPTIEKLRLGVERSTGWVVVEIPLLYECGRPDWIDKVVYVSASHEKRAERNKTRGWDEKEIDRRGNRLIPSSEKIKRADWIIENTGTLEDLEKRAAELGRMFIEFAAGTKS